MREFNINQAQAGDTGLCRDGKHEWKILCFLEISAFPMVVKITGPEVNDVIKYNVMGKNQWSISEDFPHDLMLTDTGVTKYVSILKHNAKGSIYVHHELFDTLEDASEIQFTRTYDDWTLLKIAPIENVQL